MDLTAEVGHATNYNSCVIRCDNMLGDHQDRQGRVPLPESVPAQQVGTNQVV